MEKNQKIEELQGKIKILENDLKELQRQMVEILDAFNIETDEQKLKDKIEQIIQKDNKLIM